MNKKQIEHRSLVTSAIVNLISGLLGIAVYLITDLNALLLDSVFTLIAFTSTIAAIFISKNSYKTTSTFPQGLYFLEPLYGVLKSFSILILLFITFLESSSTAVRYFFEGIALPMTTDFVLPYTILTSLMCFGLAYYNYRKSMQLNHISTIVIAEYKGNLIDGLISLGVGIAIALLHIIPIDSNVGFFHYTGDFFITVILIALFIKEPLHLLTTSFKELTAAAVPDTTIEQHITQKLNETLPDISQDMTVHVHKQGMQIVIRIHLVNIVQQIMYIEKIEQCRTELQNSLKEEYPYLRIEIVG